MGTITERVRKDKSIGYTAQIRLKQGGRVVHIGALVAVARPAWGYPLDEKALADARKVLKRLGVTGKSARRERRPTLDELDRILTHFERIRKRRPDSAPMRDLTAFALFSTRRLEYVAPCEKSSTYRIRTIDMARKFASCSAKENLLALISRALLN